MAPSTFHTRTNSLPSRSHPLTSLLDEQLSRLRSSEYASTSASLARNLNSLQGLHEYFGEWLHLPSTQQSLEKENVHELLDASLRLLDLCNSAKDALSQTKECVQEIRSILRRRGGCETEQVNKCLRSMRAMRKAIMKALKNLKNKENKQGLLKEVEAVSLTVLESLLSFIATPGKSNLSLVSKLLHKKRVGCEKEENEIANAEDALLSLMKGKPGKEQIKVVQAELQKSESTINDLEEGIEGLFRHLIKERVTLLNSSN